MSIISTGKLLVPRLRSECLSGFIGYLYFPHHLWASYLPAPAFHDDLTHTGQLLLTREERLKKALMSAPYSCKRAHLLLSHYTYCRILLELINLRWQLMCPLRLQRELHILWWMFPPHWEPDPPKEKASYSLLSGNPLKPNKKYCPMLQIIQWIIHIINLFLPTDCHPFLSRKWWANLLFTVNGPSWTQDRSCQL